MHNNDIINLIKISLHNYIIFFFSVVPVITVHPLTQPGIAGGNVTLTCTAIGFPLTIIQPLNEEIGAIVWLKNNVLVTSELIPLSTIQRVPGNTLDITVFTSLTITDLQLRDVANYSCNASNDLFEPRFDVSNDAELTVLCEHWIDKYSTESIVTV